MACPLAESWGSRDQPLNIYDFELSLPNCLTHEPLKCFKEESGMAEGRGFHCSPCHKRVPEERPEERLRNAWLGSSFGILCSLCWTTFQASWSIPITLSPLLCLSLLLSKLNSNITSPGGTTERWKLPNRRALSNSNFPSHVGNYIEWGKHSGKKT